MTTSQLSIPSSLAVGVALAAAALAPPAAAQVGSDAFRQAIEFTREKVYPALVNIAVVAEEYTGGRIRRFPAAGSGVIVSPAGHVLTNFHVAGETARVRCTLPSGEMLDATIVAEDPLTDLCVLKLALEKRVDPSIPIPFATLGDSDALHVGDHVIAVGNPLTLSSSMTLGIVSNRSRVFTDFTGTEIEELDVGEGQPTGIFNQWIQHDALILPGNSGGPLVNLRGEVVGINTRGGGGVAFAIPASVVKKVLNQALTFGEVRRGWVGISVLPTARAGLEEGALVSYVTPGSPAAQAGVAAGDLLVALAGEKVDVRFFEEVPLLYQRVAEFAPGSRIKARLRRSGPDAGEVEVTMQVESLEKFLGDEEEFRTMGITVRSITHMMAVARRYPSADGVLVTGVRPGYPFDSARPEIDTGHVILELGGKPVADLEGFRELLREVQDRASFPVKYRDEDQVLITMVETARDEGQRGKELPKAWLGVQTQVLTEKVAEALGLAGRKGFRVTQVYPWTMAAEAGLAVGDVLFGMDGDPLDASRPQDAEDLRRAIEDMGIGDEVEFDVLRDGAELKLTVELEETPASAIDVKRAKQPELEFDVRETTFMDRVRFKWPKDQQGVLVTEATMGGWAHVAGLRSNDLVLEVNGQPTPDVKAFESVMAALVKAKPKNVNIAVRRGYRTHFVFIEPDWQAIEESK